MTDRDPRTPLGLRCDQRGCPIAVEVFDGNTGDPTTVSHQIDKLRQRFNVKRVVLIGDRGMLTEARIREELKPQAMDWISALRAPAIHKLLQTGTLQPSLFDAKPLAEISELARRKASSKRTDDGIPVHSFRTMLDDLATVARNTLLPSVKGASSFEQLTTPTPLQQRAFDLLGVTPRA